jgi:hypothetical protein
MRLLGIPAAAGATLLTLATLAPALAQTAAPAAGSSTTTRSDCVPGGTLVVRQTRLESGATRVVIEGHDVPNGTWKGSFAPDASTTETDVPLTVTAKRHEFRTEIEVEDVTSDTNTTLLRGSVARACAVGQTTRPRSTSVSTFAMGLVARQQKSGDLTVRGAVVGCVNGSSWRFRLAVEAGGAGFGGGAGGVTCRKHMVRIPPLSASDIAVPPTALTLVARSHGDVRRLVYRSSTPAQ